MLKHNTGVHLSSCYTIRHNNIIIFNRHLIFSLLISIALLHAVPLYVFRFQIRVPHFLDKDYLLLEIFETFFCLLFVLHAKIVQPQTLCTNMSTYLTNI